MYLLQLLISAMWRGLYARWAHTFQSHDTFLVGTLNDFESCKTSLHWSMNPEESRMCCHANDEGRIILIIKNNSSNHWKA